MFFPPDPSVATNVAFMIDELGLETTEKYDQLVLAFAVGRREFGMGAFDLTQQGRYIDAQGKLNDLRSSGVMPPPADLYCAGKPPVNWYGNAPRTVDEECYKKVEAYLDRKKITPKQAWLRKYPTVSEIGDSAITEDNLAGFLHEYMYRHGQLRRKRDPSPLRWNSFPTLWINMNIAVICATWTASVWNGPAFPWKERPGRP